jgi:hypothetical protein
MAIYEGARPRTIALPRRPQLADAPAMPRRRARSAVRAHRSSSRPALVLGAIAVAFMLAFFSLAQQVRVSATSYDIGRLQIDQERLEARREDLASDLNRLGREPAVRKLGLDGGLGQLGEPLVLPAR